MSVVLHREGWQDATATLGVATAAPVYVHPPWISSARIRGPLLALAFAVAFVGLLWHHRTRVLRQAGIDRPTVARTRNVQAAARSKTAGYCARQPVNRP